MSFQHITNVHLQVLEHLSRYKFLTTGHLLLLQVMTDRGNLNRELKKLRSFKKPLIHTITFGVHPKLGKLESFHTLSSHGVEALKEVLHLEDDEIKYLKGTSSIFTRDYFHREAMIYFQILLDVWCMDHQCEVRFFDTYFDTVGNANKDKNLHSKTKIEIEGSKALYADGLLQIQSPDDEHYFAMEMYRGKDTGRVMLQLSSYVKAFSQGAINKKYGWKKGVRLLLVFESKANLESVLEQVSTDPMFQHMKHLFLFKTYEEVLQPGQLGFWVNGGKEVVGLVH